MRDKITNDKLKELMDQYSSELLRMSYLYLHNQENAHEVVQNVFIKVYLNYDKFNKESSERTWITRIAINECKNMLKSSWKQKIVLTNEFTEAGYEQHIKALEDNALIDLIQELPAKYREVIILYYYEELKLREISEILKTRQSTIGSRLNKARTLLEEKMKEKDVYEQFQRLL